VAAGTTEDCNQFLWESSSKRNNVRPKTVPEKYRESAMVTALWEMMYPDKESEINPRISWKIW
jgi:hypothetical protein